MTLIQCEFAFSVWSPPLKCTGATQPQRARCGQAFSVLRFRHTMRACPKRKAGHPLLELPLSQSKAAFYSKDKVKIVNTGEQKYIYGIPRCTNNTKYVKLVNTGHNISRSSARF